MDLEKSVKDAELIILESNKEITNLKSVNQDLNKKLKDEANNGIILKEQYQDQISKLQLSLVGYGLLFKRVAGSKLKDN